jgi:hypothetical protein
MALTDCPACSKKISDKSKVCSHCGFAMGEATSEDILRKQKMNRFKKMHSIQTQSMLAMLLFVAGFGFMYWGGAKPGDMQHNLAILASISGFVWYLINRVRLVILKRFAS